MKLSVHEKFAARLRGCFNASAQSFFVPVHLRSVQMHDTTFDGSFDRVGDVLARESCTGSKGDPRDAVAVIELECEIGGGRHGVAFHEGVKGRRNGGSGMR